MNKAKKFFLGKFSLSPKYFELIILTGMLFYKEMTEELIKEILAQVRILTIPATLSDK